MDTTPNSPETLRPELYPQIVVADPDAPQGSPADFVVEVPEVHTVVTGNGDVLSVEDEREQLRREAAARRGTGAADNRVVLPSQGPLTPAAPNAPRRRKSAFRISRDFAAGQFHWFDTTFYYREMTDQVRKRFDDHLAEIAGLLGIEPSALLAKEYEGAQWENVPDFEKRWEGLSDIVCTDCVIDWDDEEFAFDSALMKQAGYECKTQLMTQIGLSTRFGVSQSAFLATASGA